MREEEKEPFLSLTENEQLKKKPKPRNEKKKLFL